MVSEQFLKELFNQFPAPKSVVPIVESELKFDNPIIVHFQMSASQLSVGSAYRREIVFDSNKVVSSYKPQQQYFDIRL